MLLERIERGLLPVSVLEPPMSSGPLSNHQTVVNHEASG